MAPFDQARLLHFKKYLLCTLLILKRIQFAKQRRKRICWIRKIRRSRSQMLLNIGALENLANFTGKYLCWSLFFNKVADLQLYSKRLQHRYFPVKFAKFLKNLFLQNTSSGCFWKVCLDHPEKGGYTLLVNNTFFNRAPPVARERRLHTGRTYAVV